MLDFTHHCIEMACSLLETCGRFLYRSPESHHRMKIYLVSLCSTIFPGHSTHIPLIRHCIESTSLYFILLQIIKITWPVNMRALGQPLLISEVFTKNSLIFYFPLQGHDHAEEICDPSGQPIRDDDRERVLLQQSAGVEVRSEKDETSDARIRPKAALQGSFQVDYRKDPPPDAKTELGRSRG